jgi:RNA-directed DNA polymerase
LLANIYLHYVLDLWAHWWRRRHARGEIYIVRYADDFVVGFQYREDAERFHAALRQRLADFALDLHEDKTRLIEFGRHAARHRKARGEEKPATFDFLGFTHICGKRRKDGKFSLHRKTLGKRLRLKIRSVRETLVRERHRPVPVQGAWLRSVLQGHYNYYGVPGNRAALDTFRTQVCRAWLHALRRRSKRGRRLLWERFQRWMTEWIPTAHITHPYPNQRLCV